MKNEIVRLSELAIQALREELDTTIKPGLVDKFSSGAHKDMNYDTFNASIGAISPHFVNIAQVAAEEKILSALADKVKNIGIIAEKDMYLATYGVNTHKGAIFSLGLALTAVAYRRANFERSTLADVQYIISQLASYIDGNRYAREDALQQTDCYESAPCNTDRVLKLQSEIEEKVLVKSRALQSGNNYLNSSQSTHGKEVCDRYKVGGAMEQAKCGYFPTLNSSLKFFAELLDKGVSCNAAKVKTLLYLMTFLDDTNALHRGGKAGADWVKQRAKQSLDNYSLADLEAFDSECVEKNVSCGGACDLLTLTVFINLLITEKYISVE